MPTDTHANNALCSEVVRRPSCVRCDGDRTFQQYNTRVHWRLVSHPPGLPKVPADFYTSGPEFVMPAFSLKGGELYVFQAIASEGSSSLNAHMMFHINALSLPLAARLKAGSREVSYGQVPPPEAKADMPAFPLGRSPVSSLPTVSLPAYLDLQLYPAGWRERLPFLPFRTTPSPTIFLLLPPHVAVPTQQGSVQAGRPPDTWVWVAELMWVPPPLPPISTTLHCCVASGPTTVEENGGNGGTWRRNGWKWGMWGAADTQTAHHATFSTVPTRQLLGSANAETTPARAPAAAADRKQHSDATCEGKNG